jgi:WS/DGAT/MGAT family acyltransferase
MFLEIEDDCLPMHMGSVALFEAGPLLGSHGGLDLDRILAAGRARLHKAPRLRQKLASVPLVEHPVWIDDPRFDLAYHVRHTALPRPGDLRQLKRLAGRIFSQRLDRDKPLWETWLVEGVEGDRFAAITKLHHCMADGVSSREVNLLLGTRPDFQPGGAEEWVPRDPPAGARMLVDELVRRASAPLSLLGSAEGGDAGESRHRGAPLSKSLERTLRGAWSAAQAALRPVSDTPLGVAVGPHRRFDWTELPIDDVKRLGRAAGGTLNDVVLTLVAGAMRHFLERRGLDPRDVEFRVAVPVNVRTEADSGELGNRVSSMITPLPLDVADPGRRLARIVETTRRLKGSGESQAVDLMSRMADWLPLGVMARASEASRRAVNMIVTNVPGPAVPVYMLGARMEASYPLVPLMAHEALNVALFSYERRLCWGFNADWDALPDLHDVAESVPAEFRALVASSPTGP